MLTIGQGMRQMLQQGCSCPCVEKGKRPFSFLFHPFTRWQDEEKMKEKSTITNDYLSYVYRFFVNFRSGWLHVCRRQTSTLKVPLNILICLNFTIPIIFAQPA